LNCDFKSLLNFAEKSKAGGELIKNTSKSTNFVCLLHLAGENGIKIFNLFFYRG